MHSTQDSAARCSSRSVTYPLGRRFPLGAFATLVCIALIAALPAHGAFCTVDPSGGGMYTDVPSALSGTCNGSGPGGDHLEVHCPPGSGLCVQPPFSLWGRYDVLIEATGDTTRFEASGSGAAIHIYGSRNIEIAGRFDALAAFDPAIVIEHSEVTLRGLPSEQYLRVRAPNAAALQVSGETRLQLDTVALEESQVGLYSYESSQQGPKIQGHQVRIADNEQAGLISGGTGDCGDPSAPWQRSEVRLDLAPDLQPNYVEGNIDGFVVEGSSILDLRHTLLLGNLRQSNVTPDVALLRGFGCGRIEARQILAYDNDPFADAGQEIPSWSATGDGAIVKTEEYSTAWIQSSTLIHNQMEYGLFPGTTEGSITFRTSVGYQTGFKGVPCSAGFFASDGTSTVFGSGLSNYDGCYCNYTGPVPAALPCTNSPLNLEIDPRPWDTSQVTASSPWPALPVAIYRMDPSKFLDAGPDPAPAALFPSIGWATDHGGTVEVPGSPMDWGYHSHVP